MIKVFEWLSEAVGWVRIVASPLLIGLGIAAFVYFPNPTTLRLVVAISIAVIGLIIGVRFATKMWKTKGTMRFMSSIMATPELDKKEEEISDKKDI